MKLILTQEHWLQIAKKYGTVGPTELGKQLGVTKQRVEQVATYLRKNGVDVPKRQLIAKTKVYLAFVKENFTK